MVQIANTSTRPLHFTEKGGKVVTVEPGDAQSVDIDRDNVNVKARENARLIKVGGNEAQAKKAARSAPFQSFEPVKTEKTSDTPE